jgi:hypothetical protein
LKLSYPSLGATDYEVLRDELAMRLREQLVRLGRLLTTRLANTSDAIFGDHQESEEFWSLFVRAMPLSLK